MARRNTTQTRNLEATPEEPQVVPPPSTPMGGDGYIGFVWQQLNDINKAIGRLESSLSNVNTRLEKVESKLGETTDKVNKIIWVGIGAGAVTGLVISGIFAAIKYFGSGNT